MHGRLKRSTGSQSYNKVIIISAEGVVTEPSYFNCLKKLVEGVSVKVLKKPSSKSSPIDVLRNVEKKVWYEDLKEGDEVWVVIDKDNWTEEQFKEVLKWENSNNYNNVAISNPCFEYWLVLHFEMCHSMNKDDCMKVLKKYLGSYKKKKTEKKIMEGDLNIEKIQIAVNNAKEREKITKKAYTMSGFTNVHYLVESIINM